MADPLAPSRAAEGRAVPANAQKIRLSCDNCKFSKIRCGQERPACRRCQSHGLACCYSPSRRMGRPRSGKQRQQEQQQQQQQQEEEHQHQHQNQQQRPLLHDKTFDLTPYPPAPDHTAVASASPAPAPGLSMPSEGLDLLVFSPLDDGSYDLPTTGVTLAASTLASSDDHGLMSWDAVDEPLHHWGSTVPPAEALHRPPQLGSVMIGSSAATTNEIPDMSGAPLSSYTYELTGRVLAGEGCSCAGDLVAHTSRAMSELRRESDRGCRSLGHILSLVEQLSERLSCVMGCGSCSIHLSTTLAACQAIRVATDALLDCLDAPDRRGTDGTIATRQPPRLQLGTYTVRLDEGEDFARCLVRRRLRCLHADIERLTRAKRNSILPDDPCSAIQNGILGDLLARMGDEP